MLLSLEFKQINVLLYKDVHGVAIIRWLGESLETELHIFVLKPSGFRTPNFSHIDEGI